MKEHKCPHCGKVNGSNAGLLAHIRWHHSSPRVRARMLRAARANAGKARAAHRANARARLNGDPVPAKAVTARRGAITLHRVTRRSSLANGALPPVGEVNYCPRCGFHIRVVNVALSTPGLPGLS